MVLPLLGTIESRSPPPSWYGLAWTSGLTAGGDGLYELHAWRGPTAEVGEEPPGWFWELASLGAPCVDGLREVEAGCAYAVPMSVGFRAAWACLAMCAAVGR